MVPPSPRSATTGSRVMPIIVESSDDDLPTVPDKSPNRPMKHQYPNYPPPQYSTNTPSSRSTNPSEPEPEPKKQILPGWITRRGGWLRLVLFAFIAIAIILGLVLGLVFGLRSRNSSSQDSSGGPSSPPSPPQAFPAGSYAFTAALKTVTTSCTSNPLTWNCYPSVTYAASQTASSATFFWTINQTSAGNPPSYIISAAPNPFVPQFTNVALSLLDANSSSERLTFSFVRQASVIPSSPIGSTNAAATCYYNRSTMNATMWTRRAAEFPPGNGNGTAAGGSTNSNFGRWPFAVEVWEYSSASDGPPECRDAGGNLVGNVTVPASGAGTCSCVYSNFGLLS